MRSSALVAALALACVVPVLAASSPAAATRPLSEVVVSQAQDGEAVIFEVRDPQVTQLEVEIFAGDGGRLLFDSGRRPALPVRWEGMHATTAPLRLQIRGWDAEGRLVLHHLATRSVAELIAAIPFETVPAGTDLVAGASSITLDAPTNVTGDLTATGNLQAKNALKGYGYVRSDGILMNGYGITAATWNPSLTRYEIDLGAGCYSVDDVTTVTIRGDAGGCPAGAVPRVGSVSCHLLVYIVNSAGTHIQCSFGFMTLFGQ